MRSSTPQTFRAIWLQIYKTHVGVPAGSKKASCLVEAYETRMCPLCAEFMDGEAGVNAKERSP
jgi:hypothetical protein